MRAILFGVQDQQLLQWGHHTSLKHMSVKLREREMALARAIPFLVDYKNHLAPGLSEMVAEKEIWLSELRKRSKTSY